VRGTWFFVWTLAEKSKKRRIPENLTESSGGLQSKNLKSSQEPGDEGGFR
jgi:hypothetical protein